MLFELWGLYSIALDGTVIMKGELKEATVACFMVLPLCWIGDVKDILENPSMNEQYLNTRFCWLAFDFTSPEEQEEV